MKKDNIIPFPKRDELPDFHYNGVPLTDKELENFTEFLQMVLERAKDNKKDNGRTWPNKNI